MQLWKQREEKRKTIGSEVKMEGNRVALGNMKLPAEPHGMGY